MSRENLGQNGESLLIAAAPLTHDDALGLLDDPSVPVEQVTVHPRGALVR